ncbi:MAG TPA: menaquinone biosynthesis decarboxylase [Candidatus Deferrimicrobiaceae bacterium]|nr:menaquinone biosynthesis decarboxylase [Candidatus Deferrimicrobiaceae bacterium]
MAFRDLREFLSALEARGELKKIPAPVSADLEAAEIADRAVKSGGPALLFENVKGHDVPLAMNLFGTMGRMCLALGVSSLDEIGARMVEVIEPEIPSNLIEKLKLLPKLARLADFIPKTVSSGPCQEVVETDKPSLSFLPVVKTWPGDGGPFITLPLVFTKDPKTGRRNVGMYRMHVYDETTTGMHWHVHKGGAQHYRGFRRKRERMPLAVALGGDPATIYAASAPLPEDVDEMVFAGFLRRQPVELVRCRTVDIEVPAHAEVILEGYVDPDDLRTEGPFGDHTGYYSLADEYPVFHVTCVTRRKKPIYPATIVGKPPMEDVYLGKATERIFLPLLRKIVPEVVDMNLPIEGIFHNVALFAIDKRYPGHARKVMSAVWGLGLLMFSKFVVIFDADVNIQDPSEVLWRLGNNVDPRRDTMIVDGPVDALEHASPVPHYGSKMGIDATRKWASEGFAREWPEDIRMDETIVDLVTRRWKEYGF